MTKKEIVLLIVDQIAEWSDDNDIAMSMLDMIELGERIFNMLPQIHLEEE